ncbi:MAG: hypothetical protein FJ225_11065 [Lentisphaerae bacterium]|nr:hypothetical protein [Lentisphaerota bacterium]
MQLDPIGWSVVLVGWWNPAILSPAGIKKHVFRLPADQQVQVAVPLDGVSAYLVTNPEETLVVHVEQERLQIEVPKCTFASLQQGMQAACNALESLPVTPVSAAGFNVNFMSITVCPELVTATDCHIDNNFATQEYKIVGRSTGRSVAFGDGQINITVGRRGDQFQVNCNFHLGTRELDKARKWLQTPIETVKDQLARIGQVLNVQLEEKKDDKLNQPEAEH